MGCVNNVSMHYLKSFINRNKERMPTIGIENLAFLELGDLLPERPVKTSIIIPIANETIGKIAKLSLILIKRSVGRNAEKQ